MVYIYMSPQSSHGHGCSFLKVVGSRVCGPGLRDVMLGLASGAILGLKVTPWMSLSPTQGQIDLIEYQEQRKGSFVAFCHLLISAFTVFCLA